MNTDFESNIYTRHRPSLTRDILKLLRHFAAGYAALTHHQFDAPWKGQPAARGR